MAHKRSLQDLSFDELRRLMLNKRRSARKARLESFSRTGEIQPPREAINNPIKLNEDDFQYDLLIEKDERSQRPKTKKTGFFDKALLYLEIAAVIGLVFTLLNGFNVLRSLNREVTSAFEQSALTPTPLIMAVVLPSGHTPPNSPEGVKPNDAEIPAHLSPLIQSLANIPVPTPGPEQSIRIQIPAINVDAPVVQGDGWEQLKKGVGQTIGTPNPGENGNIVLSAHNDIFGEIFRHLDQLKTGDEITLFTSQRTYTYTIQQTQVVEPTQVEVMAPTSEPVVTLISCYPYMVSNKRIVVSAVLQD